MLAIVNYTLEQFIVCSTAQFSKRRQVWQNEMALRKINRKLYLAYCMTHERPWWSWPVIYVSIQSRMCVCMLMGSCLTQIKIDWLIDWLIKRIQELNPSKLEVKSLRFIILTLINNNATVNCCSKWFEQLPNRVSKRVASGRCSSGHHLVPGLWIGDGRSDCRPCHHHRVRPVHRHVPVRHRSESRHVGRKTLHRRNLRERRRSVCRVGQNK